MARWTEPSDEALKAWQEWLDERPPNVRAVAERFPPWELYRMKDTGQRVTVASFYEDGTVSVDVTGQFNATMFNSNVFGIDPANLEPCDLPDSNEVTGTMMTSEEVDENIDLLRVSIRPDLFVMDANGKAQRKS